MKKRLEKVFTLLTVLGLITLATLLPGKESGVGIEFHIFLAGIACLGVGGLGWFLLGI